MLKAGGVLHLAWAWTARTFAAPASVVGTVIVGEAVSRVTYHLRRWVRQWIDHFAAKLDRWMSPPSARPA